jgi:ABC-type multidrug transport system ATPase subunit
VIEAIELTSTRRSRGADGGPVQGISFDVYPGQVTALLGAPGTGKSTVLRLMAELEPGAGRTLFGGRPYRALRPAVREVGLALNPDAVHPGRTVQAHLQLYAAGGGVPKPRIAEVLEVAGLSTQATVRCGRLDPGQRQRLAIAAALLGDPAALILDEPHALDTHGMSWFHALIRAYAAQGRTVLVAATDPDTLSGTADHVVVLRRDEQDGISRVIASRSAAEVFDERRATVVQVRSPQAARLAAALEAEGASLAPAGPGALQVRGLDRARIGEVAHVAGVCLHELCEIGHDDDVFGLHPVPRQKELLPGLNRADAIWHSGVRLVADEIEEAEVIEAAAEASAEAAGSGGDDDSGGAALAEVLAQGSVAGPRESAAGVQIAAENQAGQVGGAADVRSSPGPVAAHDSAASIGTQPPAERQAEQVGGAADVRSSPGPVAAHDSAASIGTQPPAERQAEQVSGAADVRTLPGPVAAREAASVGAQAPAEQRADQVAAVTEQQAVQAGGGDVQGSAADSPAVQPDGVKPSVAGSWRTQGSVAGSRWSAVKGSQVRPGSGARVQSSGVVTVAGGQDSASNLASTAETVATSSVSARSLQDPANSADQQSTAADKQGADADQQSTPAAAQSAAAAPSPVLRTPAKSPEAPRPTHRRSGAFGLRWGRSRSQRPAASPSAEPVAAVVAAAPSSAAVVAPAPSTAAEAVVPALAQPQPAVPFTVASSAAERDGGRDGMTPWRAAAARASHRSQQQLSVAEAAPAEQETSA